MMEVVKVGKKLDLSGKSFGRITVLREGGRSNAGKVRFVCICSCGNPEEFEVIGSDLKSGHTKSCGCYEIENRNKHLEKNYTHGLSKHPLYNNWRAMIARCYNENDTDYKNYGGRGIQSFWKNNFKSFYNWAIENGYKKGLSLERIDVNGNYEPENCCFITMSEQTRNKQNTVYLTAYGETKTMLEWSEDKRIKNLELNYKALASRKKNNWSEDEILTIPKGNRRKQNKVVN
jgi:hypothetical protein